MPSGVMHENQFYDYSNRQLTQILEIQKVDNN